MTVKIVIGIELAIGLVGKIMEYEVKIDIKTDS